MSTAHPVCPRCFGFIPDNENPGAYPGALSRLDNMTEICSACGQAEAVEAFIASQRANQRENELDIDAITQANREAGVCLDCAEDVPAGAEYCGGEACQEELDLYSDRD